MELRRRNQSDPIAGIAAIGEITEIVPSPTVAIHYLN